MNEPESYWTPRVYKVSGVRPWEMGRLRMSQWRRITEYLEAEDAEYRKLSRG